MKKLPCLAFVFLACCSTGFADNIYVTNRTANYLSIIDTATNTVVKRINAAVSYSDLAINSTKTQIYAVDNVSTNQRMDTFNTYTNQFTNSLSLTVPSSPQVSTDNSVIYLLTGFIFRAVSAATNTVIASLSSSLFRTIGVRPTGTELYIAQSGTTLLDVVSTTTYTSTAQIELGGACNYIAFAPDDSKAYASSASTNTVKAINPVTRAVTSFACAGASGIAFTSDSATAYICNTGNGVDNGTVTVVRVSDNAILDTITVGVLPTRVVFSSDNSRAYVTNSSSNTVSVIDTGSRTVVATISGFSSPTSLVLGPTVVMGAPGNFSGTRQSSGFFTQTDHINQLSWTPPSITGGILWQYVIYRDASLNNLVGIVDASSPAKFLDHNRVDNQSNFYYIVAQSTAGNVSATASVTVNP